MSQLLDRESHTPTSQRSEAPHTEKLAKSAVVAVYNSHMEADEAIRQLQKSGYDMTKLSVVGKDFHTEQAVTGYYTTGDRMLAWGKSGAFWGGIWGLMFGSGFFLVPGIGPLLFAGPIVGWMVGALESAALVGGLSALGAGLSSIGIPEDSVIQYETQIKEGKFVLIAHDNDHGVEQVKLVLDATQLEGIKHHQCAA